nr:immunoglobulin light chain junction region [Macaca mulatta]
DYYCSSYTTSSAWVF